MIDRLLRLLQGGGATGPAAEEPHLSVAVLLVEAGLMHGDFSAEERAMTTRLLERRFGLSVDEVDELITRAEARARSTAQYFPFTNSLNNSMSLDDKIEVVEMLWRIAYADGHLDAFEDQLIRQLAGLLHVPDRERMLARRRVLET
ncbi:MAG: TerB family tellurite resistance protein [Hyphomicrobiaceae bacterium]